MSFISQFSEATLHRIFPGATVETYRSSWDASHEVRIRIPDSTLAAYCRADRERAARELASRILPRRGKPKHWSLFCSK